MFTFSSRPDKHPKAKKSGELFADAANGDYTLTNAPDGFEPIPFDEIGRY